MAFGPIYSQQLDNSKRKEANVHHWGLVKLRYVHKMNHDKKGQWSFWTHMERLLDLVIHEKAQYETGLQHATLHVNKWEMNMHTHTIVL